MKKYQLSASGVVNQQGKLSMYMGELNEFFNMHKGSKVVARFFIAEQGSIQSLKGYYYYYVVPTFRQAIKNLGDRLTEEQTETLMRELCPIMREETPNFETGKYEYRLRTVQELTQYEFIEYLEHLKQIAAEHYYIFIEDPKIL